VASGTLAKATTRNALAAPKTPQCRAAAGLIREKPLGKTRRCTAGNSRPPLLQTLGEPLAPHPSARRATSAFNREEPLFARSRDEQRSCIKRARRGVAARSLLTTRGRRRRKNELEIAAQRVFAADAMQNACSLDQDKRSRANKQYFGDPCGRFFDVSSCF
jgi:hypothetical protein